MVRMTDFEIEDVSSTFAESGRFAFFLIINLLPFFFVFLPSFRLFFLIPSRNLHLVFWF